MVQSDKALQQQIRLLESLLKKPENNTCADCNGKTPRWASITFGTFVCLRCSGQHRALGVHITKIKSVNLDKWPDAKVEAFKAMSNNLVNAYWEANLPANYQKPGQNAHTNEVTRFLTEKYVNKRWVDTAMKHDPLYLYENKRSRFDKFVQRVSNLKGGAAAGSDSEEEVIKQKKPKQSNRIVKAPVATPQAPQVIAPQNVQPQNVPDLISFAPAAPKDDGQFTEFVGAAPAQQQQDDGFSDFQGPASMGAPQQNMMQQQQNMMQQNQQSQMNNILGMLNTCNQTTPGTAKYAAFETMNDFDTPQQRMQKQQQLMQMQMQQQQQKQMNNGQNANPFGMQQTAQGGGGAFQPQFFNSMQQQSSQGGYNQMGGNQMPNQQQQQWQATFNTGGQQQNTQQPGVFGANPMGMNQGQPNLFAGLQQQQPQQPQQPVFNTGMPTQGFGQQPQMQNNGGFGGFQSGPSPGQQPAANSGNYYGGLVNLAPQSQPNQGMANINQQMQQQNKQQQNAAFGNLVNW